MAEIIPMPTKPPRGLRGSRSRCGATRSATSCARIRHDRGERLADTAERAGVSPQYLSEIERGLKEPSSEMIAAVAGALEVTLVDLTAAVRRRLRSRSSDRAAGTGGRRPRRSRSRRLTHRSDRSALLPASVRALAWRG